VAAAALLVRDLWSRRQAAAGARPGTAPATSPGASGVGPESPGFFDRLAADTGADLTGDAAFLAAIGFGLLAGGLVFLGNENIVAAATSALGGMAAVILLFVFLRARRRRKILEQLPDAMDYLARCVRSGQSLDQAIAEVGGAPFRPLAGEFRRCARQLAMGLSLESTLRGFALRNPLAEARILSATLAVQRQTGGNLPAALERLARVFRDRLSYQRSFRAATAASRGGLVVIVVIALALDAYVLVFSPEYAQNLIALAAGRILLGVSLALQAIGIVWAYATLKARY
ncbi:MAG: type II secretion system F family protein, partial [Thermoguttaceae bacterium]|nr:type II secretion system F family protein [Thermoguttaceae bacterium]